MNISCRIRRWIFCLILVACSVAVLPASHAGASIITDIADKLKQTGEPLTAQGITSGGLYAAESLFTCIGNGENVIVCVDSYTQGGGDVQLPSWLESFVDFYVAYVNGDVWGALYSFGEQIVCIIAPVVTGVDVCGLIKALVAVGEAIYNAAAEVYDMAQDVVEFFCGDQSIPQCLAGDLGGALWEGVKDAACSATLGLIGCDDPPPPPPPADQVCYGLYYAESIQNQQGLQAIEKGQDAFSMHLNTLAGKAYDFCAKDKPACDLAVARYKKEVDAQWTADLASRVLPELGKERAAYNNINSPQVNIKVQRIFDNHAKYHTGFTPRDSVKIWCTDDFKAYAHVDRWIMAHPQGVKDPKTGIMVQSKKNADWCVDVFWKDHTSQFAAAFTDYLKQNGCSSVGDTLQCNSPNAVKECSDLLKDTGKAGMCRLSSAAILEAANGIYKGMVSAGSTHIRKPELDLSKTKAILETSRPVTYDRCKKETAIFDKLPAKIVECTAKEDAAYTALRKKVATQVASVNGQYGPILSTGTDPLYITVNIKNSPITEAQFITMVKGLNAAGISYHTPFLASPFDGLESPAAVLPPDSSKFRTPIVIESARDKMKEVLQGGVNPREKVISNAGMLDVSQKAGLAAAAGAANTGISKNVVQSGVAAKVGSGAMTQAAQTMQNQAAMGAATAPQAKVMSGPAPTGTGSTAGTSSRTEVAKKVGATALSTQPSTIAAQVKAASAPTLPDLTAAPEVSLSGTRLPWGRSFIIDAAKAARTENGICRFPVQYSVRNGGGAMTGGFGTSWVNSVVPTPVERSWGAIPAGGSIQQTDMLGLKPGMNLLTLTIDRNGQVREGDESNNTFKLNVTVNGLCAQSKLPATNLVVPKMR